MEKKIILGLPCRNKNVNWDDRLNCWWGSNFIKGGGGVDVRRGLMFEQV